MPVSFRLFPEACIERIIERAIEEKKLFELLFTEEGRKLWRGWSEDTIKALVMKKLKINFEKRKKRRRCKNEKRG
jgi:hypothetical protein